MATRPAPAERAGGVPRLRRGVGVGVEHAPAGGAQPAQPVEVLGAVDPDQGALLGRPRRQCPEVAAKVEIGDPLHDGIDAGGPLGMPAAAMAAGPVLLAADRPDHGQHDGPASGWIRIQRWAQCTGQVCPSHPAAAPARYPSGPDPAPSVMRCSSGAAPAGRRDHVLDRHPGADRHRRGASHPSSRS